MRQGYIKALQSIHIAPSELAFTFADSYETASLEEVMKLREEKWFSRGVALADKCNKSITQASIHACEKLRKVSGCHQQIIAAACSIEHAEAIAEIYRHFGYLAKSIHSRQNKRTRNNTIKNLRNHNLDVIVQVQVLGEGFDHPPLAVAAVFRPFRSLSPYIQFIGRVMRVVRQNAPRAPENQGVVVSHVGLNTNKHWDNFRNLDARDHALLAGLICGEVDSHQNSSKTKNESDGSSATRFFRPDMLVEWERIEQQKIDTKKFASNLAKNTRSETPAQIKHHAVAGPQQRRREARSKLTSQVNEEIKSVIYANKMHPMGKQISRLFPRFRHLNNWAAVRYWIYTALNQKVGGKRTKLEKWNLAEVELGIESLPQLVKAINDEITNKRTNRKTCHPYAA